MNPYRAPPRTELFIVEAQVRGPLNEFRMQSVVQAQDAGNAIVKFVEDATAGGFDLLSEPRIVNLPEISIAISNRWKT